MVTRSARNNRLRWKRRWDEYLAEHPACVVCGSTKDCIIQWNGPKETKERLSIILRRAEPLRSQLLAQCATFCPDHRKSQGTKIVVHGGGRRGIIGCPCAVCVARSREYNRLLQERRNRKLLIRKMMANSKGLPFPIAEYNNAWNRSEAGREYRHARYQTLRDEWSAGKVCAVCGVGGKRLIPHWVGDSAYPLRVSTDVWAVGPERREEILKNCQPWCRSCVSSAAYRKRKQKP